MEACVHIDVDLSGVIILSCKTITTNYTDQGPVCKEFSTLRSEEMGKSVLLPSYTEEMELQSKCDWFMDFENNLNQKKAKWILSFSYAIIRDVYLSLSSTILPDSFIFT